jgi:hypothetical protein
MLKIDKAKLELLAKGIAQHLAAATPVKSAEVKNLMEPMEPGTLTVYGTDATGAELPNRDLNTGMKLRAIRREIAAAGVNFLDQDSLDEAVADAKGQRYVR